MSTQKTIAYYILELLGGEKHFSVRSMFGEYALYADGKVVALICDNLLYVKILPASIALENICEKGEPFPGARLHYVLEEEKWNSIEDLPNILRDIAASLPEKKLKKKK